MIIERRELLNEAAKLHRRIADLEAEIKRLQKQVRQLKRGEHVKAASGECQYPCLRCARERLIR